MGFTGSATEVRLQPNTRDNYYVRQKLDISWHAMTSENYGLLGSYQGVMFYLQVKHELKAGPGYYVVSKKLTVDGGCFFVPTL